MIMDTGDARLDLFLAPEGDDRPVLEGGLPPAAAERAPRPRDPAVKELRRTEASHDDLSVQGWALIAPEGKEGDRLLEAVEPLRRLREEEQGAPVRIHRAPPGMDAGRAADWKLDRFWPEGAPEEDVPLYALVLGDLHQVSAELQHVLATNTLVGRVHFSGADGGVDLDGYAAYAEKVVRFEREGAPDPRPDLLFYTAPDGSSATAIGKARLVGPGLLASLERLAAGKLPAAAVREIDAETAGELLEAGAGARPGVLLSVSHGVGAPRGGWRSAEARQRRQGAMWLGGGEVLDAERLRGQAFLPGGMWFYLACFGAGTPASSAYHAWLAQLARDGAHRGDAAAVLRSLPAGGERPFVAALPQAALANPRGPLAVIAHLDLAWTYSFSGARSPSETRRSRILTPLWSLVAGSRAGVALGKLMHEYAEVNDDLMREYQLEKDALADRRPSPVKPADQARRWMLRNDLRGYVLLGDPAARLPLRQGALREAGRLPEMLLDAAPAWEAHAAGSGEPEAGTPLPAEMLDAIRGFRAEVPWEPGLRPHRKGHMYTGSSDAAHLAYLEAHLRARAAGATPADRRKILAFGSLQSREGSTAAINTYDNQIVTWGTGWGGLGWLGPVLGKAVAHEAVREALARAGLRYRGKGTYDVVDLASGKVVTGKAPALEVVRASTELLCLLIHVARSPETRDAVTEAQLATFMSGSADIRGAEAIATQALFNFVAHLKHWAPGYVMGCMEWAVPLVEGPPSPERDRRLAALVTRYFYGKARAARGARWIPDWRQMLHYVRHMKQDGLDCSGEPVFLAADPPAEDPFSGAAAGPKTGS